MFSSAAALCIYNCLVGFNQEVDYCYWSALLVSLSLSLPVTHIVHALTHTHTHSHTHTHTQTHMTLRAAAVYYFAKLGQFVASFRRRLKDVPTQRLMTSWGKKRKNAPRMPLLLLQASLRLLPGCCVTAHACCVLPNVPEW